MGASAPDSVKRLVDRLDRDRKVFQSTDYKEEQLRPGFDPGRIRPILKADGGCIFRRALTRVKFFPGISL